MSRSLSTLALAIASFASLATLLTGCGADTEADANAESSAAEVRTSRCTNEVAAHVTSFAMRSYFAELTSPQDYNAMKAVSARISDRGSIEFVGVLKSRASGRCNYESADGAMSGALYTKGGKDILRLSFRDNGGHGIYIYTYPTAFAPELKYAANASARIVTPLSSTSSADAYDDVDASEAPAPFWVTLGSGKAVAGRSAGDTLANGASIERDDGPDSLRIVVPAGSATASVIDSSLATCEAKKNEVLSTSDKTVFDLTLEYEIDDGWNGCTFEFKATGYSAQVTAGFSVDD